jgi:hypothetical protein
LTVSQTAAVGARPLRMTLREAGVFAVATAVLASLVLFGNPLPLSNDSFQYLKVAESIASGKGIETPLVHFDSERSEGRIPAPMTTFAPGYPAVVALGSVPAGSFEGAARALSVAASALVVLLTCLFGEFAGLTRNGTRLALALLLLNSFFLHFSTAVASEPLFLLTSLSGLLVIARTLEKSAEQRVLPGLAFGQFLIACSYWTRYAGLFVFVAVVLHAMIALAVMRNRRTLLYAASCGISGALIGLIMIRNLLLVGNWKGGNEKHLNSPLGPLAGDYVRAQIHLLFGSHLTDGWTVATIAFASAAILAGGAALLRSRQSSPGGAPRPMASGFALLVLYVAVSTGSLLYLGKTSPISFGPRMFYPLLPLYAVGALVAVEQGWAYAVNHGVPQAFGTASCLVFLCLYGWGNLREFNHAREHPLTDDIRAFLEEPMEDGRPLRVWMEAHVGSDEVIVADNGQATGYLLRRPVLSLIESRYSSIAWTRKTLEDQMGRFHARFLILYLRMADSIDPVRTESGFLAGAICCRVNPGFHVAAENRDVRILQRDQPGPEVPKVARNGELK